MLPIEYIGRSSSSETNFDFDVFNEQWLKSNETNQLHWICRPNLNVIRHRYATNLTDLERIKIRCDINDLREETIRVDADKGLVIIKALRQTSDKNVFEKRVELNSDVDIQTMMSFIDPQRHELIIAMIVADVQHRRDSLPTINTSSRRRCSLQTSSLSDVRRSSIPGLTNNDLLMEIPPEFIVTGKILSIEKHTELFIGGRHLSRPPHPIRVQHGLCLVEVHDSSKQSSNENDSQSVIQIKIDLCPEFLRNEQKIIIRENSTIPLGSLSGNWIDLYRDQSSAPVNDVLIEINSADLIRDRTILVQKNYTSMINGEELNNEQKRRLNENPYTKLDRLNSNNLMEITLKLAPDLLSTGRSFIIRQELASPLAIELQQHQRRHSPHNSDQEQTKHDDTETTMSIKKFMTKRVWNPSLSSDERRLQFRVPCLNATMKTRPDQYRIKIDEHQHHLRIEVYLEPTYIRYREVMLPVSAQLDQLTCNFDDEMTSLNVSVPLQ
ncbi:unnamed protein product [Rotaria sordida]|uniref:Uncharacterized protein n=1 Tax=Rotaria sordida TaxID=392033 RepID=A0A815JFJ5_9BILA|nr:unnamed protein product [Rotaria sordida]